MKGSLGLPMSRTPSPPGQPRLHRCGHRALPRTHPERGRLLPEDAAVLGAAGGGVGTAVPPPSSDSGGPTPTPATRGLRELKARRGPLAPPARGAAAGNLYSSAPRASAWGPRPAGVGGRRTAGAGRGRGGSRRPNHKARRAGPGGDSLPKRTLSRQVETGLCPALNPQRPQRCTDYFQQEETVANHRRGN